MKFDARLPRRQQGVAIITALVVVAAVTIAIAGMLWRQSLAVRKLENQNALAEARWLGRSALDWARLILLQDARTSAVDHNGELWAVPLAETRIADQNADQGSSGSSDDPQEARISGRIRDAQARFNLGNLVRLEYAAATSSSNNTAANTGNTLTASINTAAYATFKRLAAEVGAPDDTAQRITSYLLTQASQQLLMLSKQASTPASPMITLPTSYAALTQALLQTGVIEATVLEALRPYVVVLPKPTPVNLNTASAEVIAACFDHLSLDQAGALAQSRDRIYFNQVSDIYARQINLNNAPGANNAAADVAVSSHYFEVDGRIRYGRAEYVLRAVLERDNAGLTQVVSVEEP